MSEQQAVVARFGTRALSGESPMQLIRDAVKEIVAVLRVDVAVVAIDDGDRDDLPLAASTGSRTTASTTCDSPAAANSFTGFVLESPFPVSMPDVDASTPASRCSTASGA